MPTPTTNYKVSATRCSECFSSSLKPSTMAATCRATSALIRNPNTPAVTPPSRRHLPTISFPNSTAANSTNRLFKSLAVASPPLRTSIRFVPRASADNSSTAVWTFHGLCYVVKDNIDTDQIIPAEYLTLVPSKPDEYKKLGSYAMIGLPESYETRFIDPGEVETKYAIVIAGDNFGCGSSREHAPVALGAAGVKAVVAESYARIFFRNSVATGEIYPLECEGRICDECRTGDVVTIELKENKLINHTTGKEFGLKPIGDAGPVIEAGGIFAYARKAGMIPAQHSA